MGGRFSRIHLLTHEYFPQRGGIATTVREIAQGLSSIGENPLIHAPGQPQPEDASTVTRTGYTGSESWPSRLAFHRYWKTVNPDKTDLVWVMDPGPLRAWLYSPVFPRKLPDKLVVTLHGSEILRLAGRPWRRPFFRRFLKTARVIHCLSEANQKMLLKFFPETEPRIVVTGGAPTLSSQPFARPPRETAQILTVGRLHPRKGQDIVLAALAALPGNLRRKISLRIVGPVVRSGYAQLVREQAAGCGFPVDFSGELTDAELLTAHHQADIFALTSRQAGQSVEGLGLVYLNAAATGLPIIATDVGGVREAFLPGQSGLLVPAGNLPALTDAFASLISNPARGREMGEAGRSWVSCLRWEKIASTVLDRMGPQV